MNKVYLYVIGALVLAFLVQSCAVSKEIKEDFRTDTYKTRMAYFAEHPLQQGQVVFFGNSITQGGEWEKYFTEENVANRGISGDNTEGMLARLDEIVAAKPRKFFIMAGINDISLSRSNQTIMRNYEAIIKRVKRESPDTDIYIESVLPINNDFAQYKRLKDKEAQIPALNAQLRALAEAENVTFLNLTPYFSDSEGRLKKEYTGDGLHLKPEVYWSWSNIIHRFVK